MTRAIRFDPSASDELFEAIDWYDERRSGLGAEFLDSVRRTLDFAVRQPRPGSLVPGIEDDPAVRRVPLARFPHRSWIMMADPEGNEFYICDGGNTTGPDTDGDH